DAVGLALVDDGRIDLVAKADVGDHAAAPLAHAVDFGDLGVIAPAQEHPTQELGGQEAALAADTDNHDIFRFHVQTSLGAQSASNLQSCSHTPQPVQRVASIFALPSVMLMAGQPIFMHILQVLHFSGSTVRGALCLSYLRRAQGRREMMTLGSSAWSSSLTAWSHSARL